MHHYTNTYDAPISTLSSALHYCSVEIVKRTEPGKIKNYFNFSQTMLRIKDPERSMDFYTRVMGMRLVRKLDFPEMKFTLYFLGYLGLF